MNSKAAEGHLQRPHAAKSSRTVGSVVCILAAYFSVVQVFALFPSLYDLTFPNNFKSQVQAEWPDSTLSGEYSIGTIVWTSCDKLSSSGAVRPNVDCGSVIVPKDYLNASAGISSAAFARQSATKTPRKGSVFLNPGGPGGSGMNMILAQAWMELDLGDLIGGEWDLIGFDPRGIGYSRPATKCFSSSDEARLFNANTVIQKGITVSSIKDISSPALRDELVTQFREFLAIKKSQAELCGERMGDELKYMGTANVVRDMDLMSEVFDGKGAKINYWGGSYGSILGAYMVNMIPDRVGYAVIDGIADPDNWANEPSHKWPANWLAHSEKTYRLFLKDCSNAGPKSCPLAEYKGEPWQNIEGRLEAFFDKLAITPLSAPFSTRPGFLTSGSARGILLSTLEVPRVWAEYSRYFAEAMSGNGTALYNTVVSRYPVDSVTRLAVTCIDSPPHGYPSPEDLVDEGLRTLEEVSIHFGLSTGLGEPDGGCQYWARKGPERFTGPWNATLEIPMLIVSNTHDPITPMTSALRSNSLMPDSSVLVIQDGPGHCSVAMDSVCTARIVRDYFRGILPENGTVCGVDNLTFSDPEEEGLWLREMDDEDRGLVLATRALHQAMLSSR